MSQEAPEVGDLLHVEGLHQKPETDGDRADTEMGGKGRGTPIVFSTLPKFFRHEATDPRDDPASLRDSPKAR